jgi:EAL and modified HD-GYP domain-containing signal transduction protein
LLDITDIVKVDFQSTTRHTQRSIPDHLGNKSVRCLAERVETEEDYYVAQEMGYSYFQGYFFEKPDSKSGENIPSDKMNSLRILKEINRTDINIGRLEEIFKQDVTLSYKLLRYINSSYFGFPGEIRSIRHALSLLGSKESTKWLSVIALSSMGADKSEELVVSSLFRANLCESLAAILGMADKASELFLVGLFSLLDAFLCHPLQDILSELPLTRDVRNALLGNTSPLLPVYRLVTAYEKGDWERTFMYLSGFDSDGRDLPALFTETVERCNKLLPV